MVTNSPRARKISHLIEELKEPFSQIDFSSLIEELRALSSRADPSDYIDTESMKRDMEFVELARDAFGELLFPREKMIKHLKSVRPKIQEHSKLDTPLGHWNSLLLILDDWLEELETIDDLNGGAALQIVLAPAMLLGREGVIEEGIIEEGNKKFRFINLPVLVINNGTGPAIGVELEVKKLGGECSLVGIELAGKRLSPPDDGKVKLGPLNRDNWKLVTLELRQEIDTELTIQIVADFGDYAKNCWGSIQSEKFIWPTFAISASAFTEIGEQKVRVSNPFVIGRPVAIKSELKTVFLNRDKELTRLQELVQQQFGMLIFIKGPRRVGKTSLILQLSEKIKDDFLVVYVNCDLLEQQIQITNPAWAETDFWREIANIAQAAAKVDREPPVFSADPTQAHIQFKEFLEDMRTKLEKRIVLVFDETDNFGKGNFAKIAHPVLDVLGDLRRQGISSVFIHELTDGFWENLGTGYEDIRVEFLNFGEMQSLASAKLVAPTTAENLDSSEMECLPNLNFTPLALAYLWQVSGGYPFIVQLICHHLVENRIGTPFKPADTFNTVVDLEDVKNIVQQIILSADDRVQIEYLSLGFSTDEKKFLVKIGRPRKSGHTDIEPRHGILKPLVLSEDGGNIQIRDNYQFPSQEDQEFYASAAAGRAFRLLLEKQVIDDLKSMQSRSEQSTGTSKQKSPNLRLRVGFLWLYLNRVLPFD